MISAQSSNRNISTLYHLQPMNLGKPDVECATSFWTRVAFHHHMLVRDLFAYIVFPLINKRYLYRNGKHVHDSVGANWWKQIAVTLNGLSQSSEEWVSVAEALTQTIDLQYLTMLPYRDVLPVKGLIRKQRAWCAVCYEEQRRANQEPYDPLCWVLEAVEICPKHHQQLQTMCPYKDCNSTFSAISSKAQIGFCPICNRWLGSLEQQANKSDYNFVLEQQVIIDSIGDLLVAAYKNKAKPKRANIANVLSKYINEACNGNIQAAADQLNMHRKSVSEIRIGNQLPQLRTLLRICKFLDITPVELLFGDPFAITFRNHTVFASTVPSGKGQREFDRQTIEQTLTAQITTSERNPDMPCPSMKMVAKRLGYDQSHLYRHFPEQCRTISKQHMHYRQQQTKSRREKLCAHVRQAVLSLHEQGTYPSQRAVSKLLGVGRGVFKDSSICAVYRSTLRELLHG